MSYVRGLSLRSTFAATAPRSAVAELGVVRRFSPSAMNVSLSPLPFRGLLASLGGVGFGGSRSLSVSANAFCSRERMNGSRALPSRRGERLSKVRMALASLTARPFGDAERASHSMAALRGGSIRLQQSTPNQALQRTAPRVTVAAISSSVPSPASVALSYVRCHFLRSTTQLPRRAPQSLSYGSLGVSTHTLPIE